MLTAIVEPREGWARQVVANAIYQFHEIEGRCPPLVSGSGRDMQMDWVHVPDWEGQPWGTWCEEWETDDAQRFNDAAMELFRELKQKTGLTTKQLTEYTGELPQVPAQIDTLIDNAQQLLRTYDVPPKPKPVRRAKPPTTKKAPLWPWLVGGAAAVLLGAVVYKKSKKRKRRR
jgi:hypothetical protein